VASPRKENAAKGLLLDELEELVVARLLLVLAPVRRRLLDDGALRLADAVGIAVRDIRHNLAQILSSYDIGER